MQCQGYRIVKQGDKAEEDICAIARDLGIKRLAFEKDHVSVAYYEKLSEGLPGIELAGLEDKIIELRAVKEAEEIEVLAQAAAIADKAFAHILGFLRPVLPNARWLLNWSGTCRIWAPTAHPLRS